MIAEVDAQLGRVFDAIKAAGAWDDTLIVFTSDHAEMMGDHYLLGKGGFHDQSQHMPLVIRDPLTAARAAACVEAFTEARRHLSRRCSRRWAASPAHVGDGRSLSPFLSSDEPPGGWRDAAHWEFDFRDVADQSAERALGLDSTSAQHGGDPHRAVGNTCTSPPCRRCCSTSRPTPTILHNLATIRPMRGVRLEMAERLLSWRARHLDQTLALKELTPNGVVSLQVVR